MKFQQILTFWFGSQNDPEYGKQRQVWFTKNNDFDEEVRNRFLYVYEQAAGGKLDQWCESPLSCLALIICLDQFPRNMFRGKPQTFASDPQARKWAMVAVDKSYPQELTPLQRQFIYLPFEHSESLADQERSLSLFATLKDNPQTQITWDYAQRHYEIIKRFGRFPHRNEILGRESTPAEIEFLQQPDSWF